MSVRYVDKIPDNQTFSTKVTQYFIEPSPGNPLGYNPVTGLNTKIEFYTEHPINPLTPWYGPIWYWDTSLVTDMSGAFKDFNMSGLFSPPPLTPTGSGGTKAPSNGSGFGLLWNTSNVINMESMFENFDAPGLNSPSSYEVYSISFLQNVATSFKDSYLSLSVKGPPSLSPRLSIAKNKYIEDDYDVWDVSKVQNMKNMFKNCLLKVFVLPYYSTGSPTILMSNWNTSSVITMESMFDGCQAGWGDGADPQKDCLPWEIIRKNGSNSYYNSWVTYNCTNFKKMFANSDLTSIYPPSFSPAQQNFLLKKYTTKKPI